MACQRCDEAPAPAKIAHTVTVGGVSFKTELDGTKCGACGETELPLGVLVAFEHAVAKHLAKNGPVSGETHFAICGNRFRFAATALAERCLRWPLKPSHDGRQASARSTGPRGSS